MCHSRLNHALFGLHSIWFHATNVMLHAAACILFTRVCTQIAGLRRNFAIFAGVLFAIHPIHTEAVSYFIDFLLSEKLEVIGLILLSIFVV